MLKLGGIIIFVMILYLVFLKVVMKLEKLLLSGWNWFGLVNINLVVVSGFGRLSLVFF